MMALFTITTLYEWPLSSNDIIIALHYEICDLVPWDFSHHLVAMWMSAAISVGFWLLFSEIFPLNCTVLWFAASLLNLPPLYVCEDKKTSRWARVLWKNSSFLSCFHPPNFIPYDSDWRGEISPFDLILIADGTCFRFISRNTFEYVLEHIECSYLLQILSGHVMRPLNLDYMVVLVLISEILLLTMRRKANHCDHKKRF